MLICDPAIDTWTMQMSYIEGAPAGASLDVDGTHIELTREEQFAVRDLLDSLVLAHIEAF